MAQGANGLLTVQRDIISIWNDQTADTMGVIVCIAGEVRFPQATNHAWLKMYHLKRPFGALASVAPCLRVEDGQLAA
jgi:hypothetical protein